MSFATLIELEISRIVTQAFESFIKTVEETTVTASGDLYAIDDIIPEWNVVVSDKLVPHVTQTHLAGSVSAYAVASASTIIPASFAQKWAPVVNQQAVQYAMTSENRLRNVGNTLWNQIRKKVTTSIETGNGREALKKELESLAKFSEYRADTIARTETSGAYNNGNFVGEQALGQYGPVEKVWIASLDDRTRQTHLNVWQSSLRQPVPFNKPFTVGATTMMIPHAPGAPAGEVVNCRCYYDALYVGDRRPNGTIIQSPPNAVPPAPTLPEPPITIPTPDFPDTQQVYAEIVEGQIRYKASRVQSVHNPFFLKQMRKGVRVENPQVTMMGGGSGAGKSTIINSGKVKLPKRHVRVDADEAKAAIPEYKKLLEAAPKEAAGMVHEESSYMAKKLLASSLNESKDTVFDGTGNGTIESLVSKVAGMRRDGAKRIVGEYVTCDTEVAVVRAIDRARQTGRFVNPEVIMNTHQGVSRIIPEAIKRGLFDELRLWDTNNREAVLILEVKDGVTKILRPDLYEAFLRKADQSAVDALKAKYKDVVL